MVDRNHWGFMDFGWRTWGVIGVLIVVVALFMGPGMWSSSTEFLWTRLWRRFRDRPPAGRASDKKIDAP